MNRTGLLSSLTAATALSLASSSACFSIPTAKEAGVSYATIPTPWPDDVDCLNGDNPGVAKEVLMGSTRTVVVAGGDHAISDDAWRTYSPSFGNQKNSDRHLLFGPSCFARSPRAGADCVGDDCRTIVELDGYTWVALSQIDAVDCIPAGGGCDPGKVQPGQLAFVVTEKCHELHFSGDAIFLNGPDGERAIMHATSDGNPTTDVDLPDGWTLTREALDGDLVVRPFGGGDDCFYNIIRDEKAQSYHQIAYAGARYP